MQRALIKGSCHCFLCKGRKKNGFANRRKLALAGKSVPYPIFFRQDKGTAAGNYDGMFMLGHKATLISGHGPAISLGFGIG
jgi:hypothetical protein